MDGVIEINGLMRLTGIGIIVFVMLILTATGPGAFADGHTVVVIGILFLNGLLTSGLRSGVLTFDVFASSNELDTFGSDPAHVESAGDNVSDGWTETAAVITISCCHVSSDFSESANTACERSVVLMRRHFKGFVLKK